MIKLYSAPVDGYTNIEKYGVKSAFKKGAALALSSGGLAISATAPTYISIAESTEESMEFSDNVGVIAIVKDAIYSAPLTAAGTALKVGDTVTLSTDGTGVTATTTAGIFQITGFKTSDKAIGDIVYGKFVN